MSAKRGLIWEFGVGFLFEGVQLRSYAVWSVLAVLDISRLQSAVGIRTCQSDSITAVWWSSISARVSPLLVVLRFSLPPPAVDSVLIG